MFKLFLILLLLISFNSFSANRIFRAASGTGIDFQTNGSSTRMTIDSAGDVVMTGSLNVAGVLSFVDLSATGSFDVAGSSTFSTASFGTTTDPASSVLVQFVSTLGGILLPRMTGVQRDALATTTSEGGLLIFNTTSSTPEFLDGTNFIPINVSNSTGNLIRVESCGVDNNGTATINDVSTLCTWIDSTNRTAAGKVTNTISAGIFSEIPICHINAYLPTDSQFDRLCNPVEDSQTTTNLEVVCSSASSSTNTDMNFVITCTGVR